MTNEDIKEELELSLTVAQGSFYKRPEFGHRFKELRNALPTDSTLSKAIKFARDAIQWMVDYKHLKDNVTVSGHYDGTDRIVLNVEAETLSGRKIGFTRFVEVGYAT